MAGGAGGGAAPARAPGCAGSAAGPAAVARAAGGTAIRWVASSGAAAVSSWVLSPCVAATCVASSREVSPREISPRRRAAVAMSQRRAGSWSIIAAIAGARAPACCIGRGGSVAISRSSASGLDRLSYGAWPSTATYKVAPRAQTSEAGVGVAAARQLG